MTPDFFAGTDQVPPNNNAANNSQGSTGTSQNTTSTTSASTQGGLMWGEGKKYKSVEELDRAMVHTQAHIDRLEKEAKDRETEKIKAKTMDEVIAHLTKQTTSTTTTTPSDTSAATTTQDKMSEEDIKKLAKEVYTRETKETQREQNRLAVATKLKQVFGTRAKEKFEEAAERFSGIDFVELAKSSPDAALELILPPEQKSRDSSFFPNTKNTASMGTSSSGVTLMKGYEGKGIIDFQNDTTFKSLKGKDLEEYIARKLKEAGYL